MRRIIVMEPVLMLATVVQWVVLATITGVAVGGGTSLFLLALFDLTGRTSGVPLWLQMILLPVGGLLNGLLLHYGYRTNKSGLKDSALAAVHEQGGRMPFRTMWIKPVTALITLGSGGSAGKEGPCSHIGASLASAIGRVFRLNTELQRRIVACGVSAGFASVFGTPIGGAIYGVEVLAIGRLRTDFLLPAIVAGTTSYEVSKAIGIPYFYPAIHGLPPFSESLFLKIMLIGIVCGVVAWIFVELIQLTRDLFGIARDRFGVWPPLMPLIGGLILSALILVIPTSYLGLSLPLMNHALEGQSMPYLGFLFKSLLVAITLGSGFYGGIVTPQFVIGAMVGNTCAHLLGISPALGAVIGLVAVVAAASNTPLAAILMGLELSGGTVGAVYVAGAAIAAYLIIGHRSVYPDQRLASSKTSWLTIQAGAPVAQEKARLAAGLARWMVRHSPTRRD